MPVRSPSDAHYLPTVLNSASLQYAIVGIIFRSVTLYNGYGEHIEHGLSALLVLVDKKPAYKDECRLKKLFQDVTREQEDCRGIMILLQYQSGVEFGMISWQHCCPFSLDAAKGKCCKWLVAKM